MPRICVERHVGSWRRVQSLILLTAFAAASSSLAPQAGGADPSPSQSAPADSARIQAEKPDTGRDGFQQDSVAPRATADLGLITHATAMMGQPVQDRSFKTVGKVEDLVLELASGQVIAALVSSDVAGQTTPVPARSFRAVGERNIRLRVQNLILLNGDKKKFQGAPRLAKTEPVNALDRERLREAFAYFGQKFPETGAAGAGVFCSGKGVLGAQVVDPAGEMLGRVKDIMMDVPRGVAVYLLVVPEGGAEAQNTLYVLPPASVRADDPGGKLVLAGDRERFLAGPHFPKEFETGMALPEFAASVFGHYGVELGAPNAPDPTRRLVRAQVDPPSSPTPTAPARSDAEIKNQFLSELIRDPAFTSANAKDFNTTVTDGRITLTGRVKNEAVKGRIVGAAERSVGAGNVVDQLQTPGPAR